MKMNNYIYTDESDASMELAFRKDRSDKRKEWLYNYNEARILDHTKSEIKIESFINDELIHFSNADTLRSVGSLIDGWKPSQRKVFYACIKRKLYKEIRVAQLAGYVSEHAAYHHGEASLQSTIIGMSQNYVGSNNINILMPNGQFGTRILGGADSASPRYIHTELNTLMDVIYPLEDMPLLDYLDDDGILVEPKYYVPIIPMILVNGMNGIGTGFSTMIPKFNPLDVVDNIKRKLKKQPYKVIHPWYSNHKGNIVEIETDEYISKGCYQILDNTTLEITELPVGIWTDNYKKFLDGLIYDKTKKEHINSKKPKYIIDYENNSSDKEIYFKIKLPQGMVQSLQWSEDKYIDGIEKFFKLTYTKGLSKRNMHLYNSQGKIVKYNHITEIYDEFYPVRYKLYEARKKHQLDELDIDIDVLQMKIRFIGEVIDEKIAIYRQKKDKIINDLYENKYYQMIDRKLIKDIKEETKNGYDHLIKMSIYLFTEEEIDKLEKEYMEKRVKYEEIQNKEIEDMWLDECDEFVKRYKKSI